MATRRVAGSIPGRVAVPSGLSFIEDPVEVHRLLKVATEALSEAFVQFRGREQKFSATLIELQGEGDAAGFTLELSPRCDWAEFTDLARIPECLILVYSKRQFLHGVHAEISSQDPKTRRVTFGPPKRMFTLQRREGVRWPLSGGYEVIASFDNPAYQAGTGSGLRAGEIPSRLSARVLDVAKGGIAIHVEDPAWLDWLARDQPIHRLAFTLQNQKFHVAGVVKSQAEIASGQRIVGHRVGIVFTRISASDREWLETYVITQSAYSSG